MAQLADSATEGTHLVLSSDDVGNLLCEFGHPDVCSARAKLLSPFSRRERRQDLEQGQRPENRKENRTRREKSSQNGYSDGNGIDVRSLIQIFVFSLMETHGQCERDFENCPVQDPVFPSKVPFFFRPV
jgi:hypothetical protein